MKPDAEWEKFWGTDYADVPERMKMFLHNLLHSHDAELGEAIWVTLKKHLYDEQWVEVAEPKNFEAGKINITGFMSDIQSLLKEKP